MPWSDMVVGTECGRGKWWGQFSGGTETGGDTRGVLPVHPLGWSVVLLVHRGGGREEEAGGGGRGRGREDLAR